ncbi:MAG: DNA-binding domain-containing protein [Acidobacteriota bacterium]
MRLAEFQRRMAADVMRPLTAREHMAARAEDGELMKDRAAGYVKPNDQLTSVERLEIYSRSYWYRLLDSLYEDFPGLRAIVGDRKFTRLSEAYLSECPSTSYTMRDLGKKLEAWLTRNRAWAGRDIDLALDMVRLEWAHIEAFDEAELRVIGPEDLAEFNADLILGLQPYVRLLELQYPVDDLRIRINAQPDTHTAASNTVVEKRVRPFRPKVGRLRKETVFVAVHRVDGDVYYRRLERGEFALLKSMARGGPLGRVLTRDLRAAGARIAVSEIQSGLEGWVAAWAQLGWLCHPMDKSREKGKRT